MDDPHYARDCREDLDQFRKARFGRTRSYAYGDSRSSQSTSQQMQSQRISAPSVGSNSLFAAANAARTRRTGNAFEAGLSTLNEDAHSTIPSSDDDLHDGVECSPCPPPMAKSSLVGGLKVRRDSLSNRNALQRAQTLSQIR